MLRVWAKNLLSEIFEKTFRFYIRKSQLKIEFYPFLSDFLGFGWLLANFSMFTFSVSWRNFSGLGEGSGGLEGAHVKVYGHMKRYELISEFLQLCEIQLKNSTYPCSPSSPLSL